MHVEIKTCHFKGQFVQKTTSAKLHNYQKEQNGERQCIGRKFYPRTTAKQKTIYENNYTINTQNCHAGGIKIMNDGTWNRHDVLHDPAL